MIIELHPNFKKAYRKRIANNRWLVKKVATQIKIFEKDPFNSVLKNHHLKGKKSNLRAFWITGDIRLVYFPIAPNCVLFLDVGSHNQVY